MFCHQNCLDNTVLRIFYIPLIFFAAAVAGVLFALSTQTSYSEIVRAFLSPETFFALRLSIMVSITAIAIALAIGIPAGYVLAQNFFPGKLFLEIVLELPLVMTPLVAGMGILFLFAPNLLGEAACRAGMDFLFSPSGAVVAQVFIATPIIIQSCKTAFEGLDYHFNWAAQTIGLKPFQIFTSITLPMLWTDILSGTLLAWTRSIGEFGATLMVAGATRFKTETLPIAIYLNITSGETGIAVACSWILIFIGFCLLLTLKTLHRVSSPKPNIYLQEH